MSKNMLDVLEGLTGYAESTPDGQLLVREHIKAARKIIREEHALKALTRWRSISLAIACSIIDRIDGYYEEINTPHCKPSPNELIDWIRERLATSIPEREE